MKRALIATALFLPVPVSALAKETSVNLRYSGWKCGFCAVKVEKAVQRVKGVRKVTVDKDRLAVRFDDETATTDDLLAAIEKAGPFKASVDP